MTHIKKRRTRAREKRVGNVSRNWKGGGGERFLVILASIQEGKINPWRTFRKMQSIKT